MADCIYRNREQAVFFLAQMCRAARFRCILNSMFFREVIYRYVIERFRRIMIDRGNGRATVCMYAEMGGLSNYLIPIGQQRKRAIAYN